MAGPEPRADLVSQPDVLHTATVVSDFSLPQTGDHLQSGGAVAGPTERAVQFRVPASAGTVGAGGLGDPVGGLSVGVSAPAQSIGLPSVHSSFWPPWASGSWGAGWSPVPWPMGGAGVFDPASAWGRGMGRGGGPADWWALGGVGGSGGPFGVPPSGAVQLSGPCFGLSSQVFAGSSVGREAAATSFQEQVQSSGGVQTVEPGRRGLGRVVAADGAAGGGISAMSGQRGPYMVAAADGAAGGSSGPIIAGGAQDMDSSCSSSRQNLTLSLSSAKEKGPLSCNLYVNGGICSKYSGSVQSLASVRSANSCPSCACPNNNSWDKMEEDDVKLVNIPVTTPENLYLMGMELFEEALRRWEQALTFRNRQAEDETNCGSIKLGAGDAIAEENVEDIISAEFIHKLESLLQRAYRLQEEFEATLGASDPASLANDIDKDTDITVKDSTEDFGLRDTLSIASTDSFISAAELTEQREMRNTYRLGSLCHCPLYEEAMRLADEGRICSRVLRTEMLECLGDTDFLAKLHCVREAFQVILSETNSRTFLAETGRKMLSALIVKAKKNPKKFEDIFDEMLYFLEQKDHWESTKMELFARGVKKLNFYDIVLDFILMDSFEDLENPPFSIQNVVNNRWLNSSFKETAVASSCWSVLKQKRQQMKVPDGFFAHFYAICDQLSPILAWGFLGPRNSFHDLCSFFKDQALYFLKDIFDFEKVRYSNTEILAEDIMQLLRRRTELFVAYLEADSLRHAVNERERGMSGGSVETKVQ